MKSNTIHYPQPGTARSLFPQILFIGILIITLSCFVIFYIDELNYSVAALQSELISRQLSYFGHTVLLASGILYITLLWNNHPVLGYWATSLATLGVIVTGTAFAGHMYESHKLLEMGQIPVSNLYELSLFFTLLTISIYLIMEQVYQSRSAGAFMTPVVFSAIGLQLWLESNNQTASQGLTPAIQYYWMHAHILVNLIGYGAFAIAAATASMYLLQQQAQTSTRKNSITQHFPPSQTIYNWTYSSISAGLPVFTLAAVLGPLWTYYGWSSQWLWNPMEAWSIIVLICYGSFFYAHKQQGYSEKTMAWWAVISFIISSGCFFAIKLLPSSHYFVALIE